MGGDLMSDLSQVLGADFSTDLHDLDYVSLVALAVGTATTDLLVDNSLSNSGGTNGPACPDNYTFRIDYIVLTNTTAGALKCQVWKTKGAGSPICIGSFEVPANSSLVENAAGQRLYCQYGYRFQVSSSAAGIDVTAYGRLTLGGGI